MDRITSAARSSRSATIAGVNSSAMAHLPSRARPIECRTQLLDQFTLRPREAIVIDGYSQNALFLPAVLFDLIGAAAGAPKAARGETHAVHATPPSVSIAQYRIAIASASLSSAGLKPRLRAASIIACFGALPLPVA